MVTILSESLYSFYETREWHSIVNSSRLDNAYHEDAYDMLGATNAINRLDPGTSEIPGPLKWARGAVIEQIAEGLLRIRRPKLKTEQCIGPLNARHGWTDGKSDSIDFFAEEAPQEFWDAKSYTRTIKPRHVNQFNLLLDMADYGSVAGFITLEERAIIVSNLSEFTQIEHPLYAYSYENFETMQDERPITRVDPNI